MEPANATKTDSASIQHGSCLSQAIRYELTNNAFRTVLCHCLDCKKATGSPFIANSWYNVDQLRIVSGQNHLRSYKYDSPECSVVLDRMFCDTCGSPLFVTNTKSEGHIIIMTGTMDELQDWKPEIEYHCRRRRDWIDHLDNTKKLETM